MVWNHKTIAAATSHGLKTTASAPAKIDPLCL